MRNEHSNDFELTGNRISKYQEEGYLLFPSFLNKSEVHECKQRVDNYIEKAVPEIPGTEVFYEDKNDNAISVSCYNYPKEPEINNLKVSLLLKEFKNYLQSH